MKRLATSCGPTSNGTGRVSAKTLAELEARNVGKAISSVKAELAVAVDHYRFFASAIASIAGRSNPVGGSLLFYSLKDPVGVIEGFARYVADGLLPNNFPDHSGEIPGYNTVDATLWYIVAIHAHVELWRIQLKVRPDAQVLQRLPGRLDLAQHGRRVTLFERERFPRFHIGESLIPETYWVFKRLNMLDKMKKSAFVKKYSVQFVNASGKLSAPFYFWDNKPHECSQTWQVVRSEFDQMLLDNAREHYGHDLHSVDDLDGFLVYQGKLLPGGEVRVPGTPQAGDRFVEAATAETAQRPVAGNGDFRAVDPQVVEHLLAGGAQGVPGAGTGGGGDQEHRGQDLLQPSRQGLLLQAENAGDLRELEQGSRPRSDLRRASRLRSRPGKGRGAPGPRG